MDRHRFLHDGLHFSYLDAGGEGRILIALHAHWMEALTYSAFAKSIAPEWRVVALDQRGHGQSDHAPSYAREDYLSDLDGLLSHLGVVEPVVLMGNSLGGVNAYQFAARSPARVRALIVEDIGVHVSGDADFILAWSGTFETREQLAERIGPRLLPYLQDSVRATPDGWRLAFDPPEIVESQKNLAGDYWRDWLASDCPALIVRGLNSPLTTQSHLEDMAMRRPNARLETLEGGHVVHFDNPDGFARSVRAFLDEL